MDLAKRYKDSNGNQCDILQMVSREPEWAANRLQAGEILAQIVIAEHGQRCTYPGGEPTCLWDEGEVCSIHMSGKAGCKWWVNCDCKMCTVARTFGA